MLPLCHHTEHSDNKEKEPGAHNGPEYFSQEPHYIHDEMIDVPPVII
jgi:hypothetical protein